MSRRATLDNSNAVSLFPFLAVLLCTMGTLVVLLVVMSHAASQRAAMLDTEPETLPVDQETVESPPVEPLPVEPAPLPTEPDAEALQRLQVAEQRANDANRRAEQLDKFKQQAEASLRDDELRISHVEDHTRKLREQLTALKQAERELAALEDSYQDEQGQAEQELARLQQLIAETEEEVERIDQEQAGKQTSYAIVPFKGVNGTRRRPLYIECRKDQVLLQPEGVQLEPIDFRPPLGVGNPLSAALRAARKYYRQANPDSAYDPDSEPYPLIIVRPDGIKQYHRVRAALESGDADFGYEMVNGDWDLNFGLPNPELADRENQAIDLSRIRRHALAQAAPSAYDGTGLSSPRVADLRGGGGGGVGSRQQVGGSGEQSSTRAAGSFGPAGGPYSPEDTLQYGGAGRGDRSASPSGGQPASYTDAGQAYGSGAATPGQPETDEGNPYGAFAAGAGQQNSDETGEAGSPYAAAQQAAGREASGGGQQANAAGQPANADGQPGAAQPNAGQASQQAASQAGGSPGGSPGSPSTGQNVSASFGQTAGGSGQGAGGAGSGGSSRRRRGDLAIQRPISLMVHGDRVVVTPLDSNGRVLTTRQVVLPLSGRTDQHLADVMTAVQQQVNAWGIAGRGFYWKPVLVLSVAADGTGRAGELVSLLRPRGVEIRYHNTANRGGSGAQR